VPRNLQDLWADDPVEETKSSEKDGVGAGLWDDDAPPTEKSDPPAPDVSSGLDPNRIWERDRARPPPHPPTRSPNGRQPSPGARSSRRSRRLRLRPRVVILVLVVLLMADAAWASISLKGALESTRDELQAGRDALALGQVSAAEGHFARAGDGANDAEAALKHPTMLLASAIPVVKDDVAAVQAVEDASALATESGQTAIEMAKAIGVGEGGFATSFYDRGRLNLDALEGSVPYLDRIVESLGSAEARLADAPDANLGIIADAVSTASERVSSAADSAVKGSDLFEVLPGMLGQGGERRYLLAFQTPSEARGTGGLVGLIGELSVNDGKIELEYVRPYSEVFPDVIDPVDAPKWYEEQYGQLYATRQWQQANLTSDFPTAAKVMLRMIESQTGDQLNGVLAMDPIVLGDMLAATGPLTAEGSDQALDSTNAAEFLLKDSYVEFEVPEAQSAYLSSLVEQFWGKVAAGDLDSGAFLSAAGNAASTGHLKVFDRKNEHQDALEKVHVDGGIGSYGPNTQMVFHNQLGAIKIDYYLRREVDTQIRLDEAGAAHVTTTVTMRNTAPDGPPSLLLGPHYPSDPPGLNRMLLSVALPETAEQIETFIGEKQSTPDEGMESSHRVVSDFLEIPSGETATYQVTYRLPGALSSVEEGASLQLAFSKQSTVRPDELRVTIEPPAGFQLLGSTGSVWELEMESDEGEGITTRVTLVQE